MALADEELDLRFIVAPNASRSQDSYRLVWPLSGIPIGLDLAGSTLLDCFADGATVREVAEDLVAAIGLEPEVAMTSVSTLVDSLRRSRHLVDPHDEAKKKFLWSYPPMASP
jgi:hypothetical protein